MLRPCGKQIHVRVCTCIPGFSARNSTVVKNNKTFILTLAVISTRYVLYRTSLNSGIKYKHVIFLQFFASTATRVRVSFPRCYIKIVSNGMVYFCNVKIASPPDIVLFTFKDFNITRIYDISKKIKFRIEHGGHNSCRR